MASDGPTETVYQGDDYPSVERFAQAETVVVTYNAHRGGTVTRRGQFVKATGPDSQPRVIITRGDDDDRTLTLNLYWNGKVETQAVAKSHRTTELGYITGIAFEEGED